MDGVGWMLDGAGPHRGRVDFPSHGLGHGGNAQGDQHGYVGEGWYERVGRGVGNWQLGVVGEGVAVRG